MRPDSDVTAIDMPVQEVERVEKALADRTLHNNNGGTSGWRRVANAVELGGHAAEELLGVVLART
jgi:hypothetical protein